MLRRLLQRLRVHCHVKQSRSKKLYGSVRGKLYDEEYIGGLILFSIVLLRTIEKSKTTGDVVIRNKHSPPTNEKMM